VLRRRRGTYSHRIAIATESHLFLVDPGTPRLPDTRQRSVRCGWAAKGGSTEAQEHQVSVPNVDVAQLRASLGLSQTEFAEAFGVSVGTIRNWVQGRRRPTMPSEWRAQAVDLFPRRWSVRLRWGRCPRVCDAIIPLRCGCSAV